MADLSTEYMGLELANPIIAASSGLTGTVKGIRECASAGAGAVVLKSLFEEQILNDLEKRRSGYQFSWHTEVLDYLNNLGMELGCAEYLDLIREAKEAVSVPVIASLNCISSKWWLKYAARVEGAGADALELNISYLPRDPERLSTEIEHHYLTIAEEVGRSVSIPVAVKIGPWFTSMSNVAAALCETGVSSLVLFNRFLPFDIDIDNEKVSSGTRFSSPKETALPLRWTALLSEVLACDLAASTGIHDAPAAIKHLLAGASVCQVCSILYLSGIGSIRSILDGIETWMKARGYRAVSEFRGQLSQEGSADPELYERLQYIRAFTEE
jgi:dihydroorotate dehydrogenase (fumarate)